MGRGWSSYDWREQNIQFVQKWENEALLDIVHQLRYIIFTLFYCDDHTMHENVLLSSQLLMQLLIFADHTIGVHINRTCSGTTSTHVLAWPFNPL